MNTELVRSFSSELRKGISRAQDLEPHSVAFALRILESIDDELCRSLSAETALPTEEEIRYGGFPRLAQLGFSLRRGFSSSQSTDLFLIGVRKLMSRTERGLEQLNSDDIALLGIANGLAHVAQSGAPELKELQSWMVAQIESAMPSANWTNRARALAGDLTDNRGRLKVLPSIDSTDIWAADVSLRSTWPEPFKDVQQWSSESIDKNLNRLILSDLPESQEIETFTIYYNALRTTVSEIISASVKRPSDVAALLRGVQNSLKRWRWSEVKGPKNSPKSQWLINDEYDVQSLLWAILSPIFSDLMDEEFVSSWGNLKPRIDLAIPSLGLIVEVKFIRSVGDFKDVEEQVAGDLGIYFKDSVKYHEMIVFIYDDSDMHAPEKYDSLKNALCQRDRIADVVFARRPSMLPSRSSRRSPESQSAN